MTIPALEELTACQAVLIAALDSRDCKAITSATARLADAVADFQKIDVRSGNADTKDKIEYGLKQCTAALTRIHYLSAWTRQKIDLLDMARGKPKSNTYLNIRNR